jgi:hypothetical protein
LKLIFPKEKFRSKNDKNGEAILRLFNKPKYFCKQRAPSFSLKSINADGDKGVSVSLS